MDTQIKVINDVDYYDRIKQLVTLALQDNSAEYETDITGIFYNPSSGEFSVISASGCSCWDGMGIEYVFQSISDVKRFLFSTYLPFYITDDDADALVTVAFKAVVNYN